MNGYQNLANAIIEQAVKDYREALRRLKRHPDSRQWRRPWRWNASSTHSGTAS